MARKVEKKISNFPQVTLKYRSFDSAPQLYNYNTMEELLQSPCRDHFGGGTALLQSVRNSIKIIDLKRKNHPNTKCLLFIFTDCDDNFPSVPKDLVPLHDSGFSGVIFRYNIWSKDIGPHCRKVEELLRGLDLISIHVKPTDNDRLDSVIDGTLKDIFQALSD